LYWLDDVGFDVHHEAGLYFLPFRFFSDLLHDHLSFHEIIAVFPIDDEIFVIVDDNFSDHCFVWVPVIDEAVKIF
jgi:hypothetical protein